MALSSGVRKYVPSSRRSQNCEAQRRFRQRKLWSQPFSAAEYAAITSIFQPEPNTINPASTTTNHNGVNNSNINHNNTIIPLPNFMPPSHPNNNNNINNPPLLTPSASSPSSSAPSVTHPEVLYDANHNLTWEMDMTTHEGIKQSLQALGSCPKDPMNHPVHPGASVNQMQQHHAQAPPPMMYHNPMFDPNHHAMPLFWPAMDPATNEGMMVHGMHPFQPPHPQQMCPQPPYQALPPPPPPPPQQQQQQQQPPTTPRQSAGVPQQQEDGQGQGRPLAMALPVREGSMNGPVPTSSSTAAAAAAIPTTPTQIQHQQVVQMGHSPPRDVAHYPSPASSNHSPKQNPPLSLVTVGPVGSATANPNMLQQHPFDMAFTSPTTPLHNTAAAAAVAAPPSTPLALTPGNPQTPSTTTSDPTQLPHHPGVPYVPLPPLHLATSANKPSFIRALLASGADVNEADASGQTALHAAVRAGNADVARLLLEYGADVNMRDAGGWTPLHEAAWGGWEEGLGLLVEFGLVVGC